MKTTAGYVKTWSHSLSYATIAKLHYAWSVHKVDHKAKLRVKNVLYAIRSVILISLTRRDFYLNVRSRKSVNSKLHRNHLCFISCQANMLMDRLKQNTNKNWEIDA